MSKHERSPDGTIGTFNIFDCINRSAVDNTLDRFITTKPGAILGAQEIRGDVFNETIYRMEKDNGIELRAITDPKYGLALMWNQTDLNLEVKHSLTLDLPGSKIRRWYETLVSRDATSPSGAMIVTFVTPDGRSIRAVTLYNSWHGGDPDRIRRLRELSGNLKQLSKADGTFVVGDANTLHNVSVKIGNGKFKQREEAIRAIFGPEFTNPIRSLRHTASWKGGINQKDRLAWVQRIAVHKLGIVCQQKPDIILGENIEFGEPFQFMDSGSDHHLVGVPFWMPWRR